jgi:hypothetical protein
MLNHEKAVIGQMAVETVSCELLSARQFPVPVLFTGK